MRTDDKTQRVSLDELSDKLDAGLTDADRLRNRAVEQLHDVRQVRTVVLQRERQRIVRERGQDDARVRRIDQQLRCNQHLTKVLQVELERAQHEPPEVDEKTWVVDGYVRDRSLQGVPGLTIALLDGGGRSVRRARRGLTGDDGYFKLSTNIDLAAPVKRGIKAEAKKQPTVREMFLHVLKGSQKRHVHPRPLTARAGSVDYVEIYLPDDGAKPGKPGRAKTPPAGSKTPKKRTK